LTGVLMGWYYGEDNDKGKVVYEMEKEIRKAFDFFVSKYIIFPDICQISLSAEKVPRLLDFDGHMITVSRHRNVLPKSLLIGLEKEVDLKQL